MFVAFAPIENPEIAIAVVVENGGGGSSVAAPIARKVMDFHLLGVDANAPIPSEHEIDLENPDLILDSSPNSVSAINSEVNR